MTAPADPATTPRRLGDRIEIVGSYQHRARRQGFVVQRFWHHLKTVTIARVAPPDPDMTVLDVGCGSGVVADYLASRSRMVHAVDCNPLAVAFARDTYRRENLQFHLALADEIAFRPGSIDRIYCLEFIEHLYPAQVGALLARLAEILKPGGTIFLTTPNYHSAWPLIEKSLDVLGLVPTMAEEQHVWRPTRRRLRELARSCGFVEVRMGGSSGLAPFASVLGWRLAEAVDRLETRLGAPFGNLLFVLWRRA